MKLFEEISNPREIRRKFGLNQHDFWSKVGVTEVAAPVMKVDEICQDQ